MKSKWITIAVLCLLVAVAGCTKEKANALQVAAQQFRNEALAAIDLYQSLSIATVQMPQESQDEKVAFLVGKLKEYGQEVDARILNSLMNYGHEADGAMALIEKEFQTLRTYYTTFYTMFDSLERGRYFNSDDVARAQHVAIKLTLQLITYAEQLHSNDGYLFTGERVLALERLNDALKKDDEASLHNAVRAVLRIRAHEKAAKEAVIVQLLKAAEAGRVVTDAIKEYDALTANDILNNIKDSLNLFSDLDISGTPMEGLISKYTDYSAAVQEDPYWSPLLDRPFK